LQNKGFFLFHGSLADYLKIIPHTGTLWGYSGVDQVGRIYNAPILDMLFSAAKGKCLPDFRGLPLRGRQLIDEKANSPHLG
jgi:hypothetical protein